MAMASPGTCRSRDKAFNPRSTNIAPPASRRLFLESGVAATSYGTSFPGMGVDFRDGAIMTVCLTLVSSHRIGNAPASVAASGSFDDVGWRPLASGALTLLMAVVGNFRPVRSGITTAGRTFTATRGRQRSFTRRIPSTTPNKLKPEPRQQRQMDRGLSIRRTRCLPPRAIGDRAFGDSTAMGD